MPSGRKWTTRELNRRFDSLAGDGFTPEEAWDLALWNQTLNHWVIKRMRSDRRKQIREFRRQGLTEDDIEKRLTERYIELGIRGQFEDEEWYYERTGA